LIKRSKLASLAVAAIAIMIGVAVTYVSVSAGKQDKSAEKELPLMRDETLSLELVTEGLELPTSMAFLDAENILVLEKNGQVRLVSDGKLYEKPVLQVDVAKGAEQGLLGIAIANDNSEKLISPEVYLYFTEPTGKEQIDSNENFTRNRVYRYNYETDVHSLVNSTLILDLPGEPGPFHNGGKIAIGPLDGHLYAVIGDVNAGGGMLDNELNGRMPDDQSVILRVDRETGKPLEDNPFYHYNNSKMEKLTRYYAYGIRNGFGMDFDPISHLLWMTENGPDSYDEINVVTPGFNSGWHKVMGPIARTNVTVNKDLVMFEGGEYHDPVFSWHTTVGVTDIEFYSSDRLGEKYENNIFVGDINHGNLYFFELNDTRTGVSVDSAHPELLDFVADPVNQPGADPSGELASILIGEGFGRLTDIETGLDGFLYILTYEDGKIFRATKR